MRTTAAEYRPVAEVSWRTVGGGRGVTHLVPAPYLWGMSTLCGKPLPDGTERGAHFTTGARPCKSCEARRNGRRTLGL